jgi:hypothetical protein
MQNSVVPDGLLFTLTILIIVKMKHIFLPSMHNFVLQSEKPKRSPNGNFNTYRCSNCGIEGKQYTDEKAVIIVSKNYPAKMISNCPIEPKEFVGLKIKITEVWSLGSQWNNIKKDTIHMIVPSPQGKINGDRGVWVKGVGEPVKIFFDEFEFVETTFKRNKFN